VLRDEVCCLVLSPCSCLHCSRDHRPTTLQHANASTDEVAYRDNHHLLLEYHSNSILKGLARGVLDSTLRICDARIPQVASELTKCVLPGIAMWWCCVSGEFATVVCVFVGWSMLLC
jgi:hypothetical protein